MNVIYDKAASYLGLREITGNKHNVQILQMFADVGNPQVRDDETSWCAAFVGSVLRSCGYEIPPAHRNLTARSYLDWGTEVDIEDAKLGDVVVFWRESPQSWKGHVGFYNGVNKLTAHISVLGGNQKNSVSNTYYERSRLLSVRRAPQRSVPENKHDETIAEVLDLLEEVASKLNSMKGT